MTLYHEAKGRAALRNDPACSPEGRELEALDVDQDPIRPQVAPGTETVKGGQAYSHGPAGRVHQGVRLLEAASAVEGRDVERGLSVVLTDSEWNHFHPLRQAVQPHVRCRRHGTPLIVELIPRPPEATHRAAS